MITTAKFLELCASRPWPEIQAALKNGANPNAADDDGVSALMLAAKNTPDAVKVLLVNGANINTRDNTGRTALMYAVSNTLNTETVNILLENGADINTGDNAGNTPLIFAASNRPRLRIMRALVEARADVNARNGEGFTALMFAAAKTARPDVITLLLDAGAEVDAALPNGWTALMFAAAANQNPEVIQALCCGRARVNLRTEDRRTALMIASEHNPNAGVVEELIRHGADVNARDAGGRTALTGAALRNSTRVSKPAPNPEIINVLLDGGANAGALWDGERAVDIVRDSPWLQGTETLKRLELLSAKGDLAALVEQFLVSLSVNQVSAAIYRKTLRAFFAWLGERGREWPEQEELLAWRNKLVSSHRKPVTVLNYLSVVRNFFQWAHRKGLCGEITEGMESPKVAHRFRDDTLTGEQIQKMLDSIDRKEGSGLRDYALLSLILSCGLGYAEISKAKVGDFKTTAEGVFLKVSGERVEVPSAVMDTLWEYWAARGDAAPESPVFDGGETHRRQPMSAKMIGVVVKRIAKKAGPDTATITPGSLRHTAVKLALRSGRRIEDVRKFARHRDIETTYRYGGTPEKRRSACGETIAAALF